MKFSVCSASQAIRLRCQSLSITKARTFHVNCAKTPREGWVHTRSIPSLRTEPEATQFILTEVEQVLQTVTDSVASPYRLTDTEQTKSCQVVVPREKGSATTPPVSNFESFCTVPYLPVHTNSYGTLVEATAVTCVRLTTRGSRSRRES